MNIDLHQVPFSRSGAYLAFSELERAGESPAGLYLRCLHGGAAAAAPGGRLARVEMTLDGETLSFQTRAFPERLDLLCGRGTLSICIAEPFLLLARGEGTGLRLTFDAAGGDFAIPAGEGRWRINSPRFEAQYMISALQGALQVDAPWTGTGAERVIVELAPGADGVCELAFEEYATGWRQEPYDLNFEENVQAVREEFARWAELMPALPPEYEEARLLAAYVTWASMVEPIGHLLRPSMLMSKNWMTSIWSWDHCFNAMALVYRKQISAWDQLMSLFDQQDELGALPDYVNDRSLLWNFCKPPVHGWALGWMLQHISTFRADQLRQIYNPLCRWTEWWFRYRDDDRDGLPQYHHGNDSGWDNATPFMAGVPLESPDLCAFLVLQMETLARIAEILNNGEEAESWARRAEELLQRMLRHFWQDDHFIAMRSGDHMVEDDESLLLYLPLLLGKRLPPGVVRELINGLTRPGRFLTDYGLATESPNSPYYQADGYWRGPIWAPPTLMIVEGLAACGELTLARDIARRFCDMAAREGFAENFNALTGEGLRDRAYTWTASVFIILAHEYLLET